MTTLVKIFDKFLCYNHDCTVSPLCLLEQFYLQKLHATEASKRNIQTVVLNLGKISFRGYNNHQDVLTEFYNHFMSINASPCSMCSYCKNNAVGQMVREFVVGKGN